MVAPLAGFFQSFLPVASPMKLSTVTGALSGKSVQVMLPSVVSKTACTGAVLAAGAAGLLAAGLVAVDFGAVLPVCAVAIPASAIQKIAVRKLRMVPPIDKCQVSAVEHQDDFAARVLKCLFRLNLFG